MAEIPPGLRKRWETFGRASRVCWKKAKEVVEPGKDILQFWECMEKLGKGSGYFPEEEMKALEEFQGRITPAMAEKCAELGHPVAPHPICVMRKVAEGLSESEAVETCLAEGKYHGISALRCEALLKERGAM